MWRACERFKLNPLDWERLSSQQQADFLAYEGLRQHEEFKQMEATMGPV